DAGAEIVLEAAPHDRIGAGAGPVRDAMLDADEVKNAELRRGVHFDQQIDIGIGPVVAARPGSEDCKMRDTLRRELRAEFPERFDELLPVHARNIAHARASSQPACLVALRAVQPTKARSTTNWPGSLTEPSSRPAASTSAFTSFSISIEPQIMTRSVSGLKGSTPRSRKSDPSAMRDVMRPVTGEASRVVAAT